MNSNRTRVMKLELLVGKQTLENDKVKFPIKMRLINFIWFVLKE